MPVGKSDLYVGIDVGAPKKGYHAALLRDDQDCISDLLHFQDPERLTQHLLLLGKKQKLNIQAIAIDSPRKAWFKSHQTRAAEREMRLAGYRVLWTPRKASQSQAWMEHGAALWQSLLEAFNPETKIIEGFPTALSESLYTRNLKLPLQLLAGKHNRKYYPDLVDAAGLALLAREFHYKNAIVYGKSDQLNPIHSFSQPIRNCTLVLVLRKHKGQEQILLGLKKCGFGKGYWNGFGGKIEASDKTVQAAAARELLEESGLVAKSLEPRGRLVFTFGDEPDLLMGHVFVCTDFTGQPTESDEMRPRWYDLDKIPYAKMWEDDIYWLPWLLQGCNFQAYFQFDGQMKLLAQSLQVMHNTQ